MKYYGFAAALLMGLMIVSSCSNDDDFVPDQSGQDEMVTYILYGEADGMTRLSYNDANNKMTCLWDVNDVVTITGNGQSYRFDVTEVDNDGSATLRYYGTNIYDADNFNGVARYTVTPPSEIVQLANGIVDGNGTLGYGPATEHLKYGEVLTAEVHGLTNSPRLTFYHTETSAYRVTLVSPAAFRPGEATLTMTVGEVTKELKLGFGAQEGETVVAYMLSGEATVPAGGALEFVLKLDGRDFVYTIPLNKTTPKTYGIGKFWLAPLTKITPVEYKTMSLERMTLEEKVAQMFIVHPERLSGTSLATGVNTTMVSNLQNYAVGGVILFGDNIVTPTQTTTFINDIKKYCKYTPFIAVDEEGGRVARIGKNASFGVETFPSMLAVGHTGDTKNAEHAGDVIGAYLSKYGFNLDFAPVADVFTNPKNTVIGNRAFSANADTVAWMVSACIDGLHKHNILATMKHFPGHGDTSTDSHSGYTKVDWTWDQMWAREIIPFRYNRDKADMIMMGHIAATKINEADPKVSGSVLPSTMSYKMIAEKLRGEIGYNGIIITDAMQMAAITKYYTQSDAAITAIKAGVDIILCPGTFLESNGTYKAVLNAVRNGEIPESRINESVERIIAKKNRLR